MAFACVDRYLDALVGLKDSPFFPRCKRITKLRLQAELYGLTQVIPLLQPVPQHFTHLLHAYSD